LRGGGRGLGESGGGGQGQDGGEDLLHGEP
jgi:hypothetical protein